MMKMENILLLNVCLKLMILMKTGLFIKLKFVINGGADLLGKSGPYAELVQRKRSQKNQNKTDESSHGFPQIRRGQFICPGAKIQRTGCPAL